MSRMMIAAADFDEFWDTVFGTDWYIDEHDDGTGVLDNPTEPEAVAEFTELWVRQQFSGELASLDVAGVRRRFPLLLPHELCGSVVHKGEALDAMRVLKRWLAARQPAVEGAVVSIDVPAAHADEIRGMIAEFLAVRGES